MSELEFLGRGEHGEVWGKAKDAIKIIEDEAVFYVESKAHWALGKVKDLRGRIPAFRYSIPSMQHIHSRRVDEQTLLESLPDDESLVLIKEHVSETISIMHQNDWVHGDIALNNIFTSGTLYAFSRAKERVGLSMQDWEKHKALDLHQLETCCQQVISLRKLRAAVPMLSPDTNVSAKQTEVADMLRQLEFDMEPAPKLEKPTGPNPSPALEISRLFESLPKLESALCILQELKPLLPSDYRSRILYIKTKRRLMLSETSDVKRACVLQESLIRTSEYLLGRTNNDTIRLKLEFVKFLNRVGILSDALDIVTTLRAYDPDTLDPAWQDLFTGWERTLLSRQERRAKFRQSMLTKRTLSKNRKEDIPPGEQRGSSKKQKIDSESGT